MAKFMEEFNVALTALVESVKNEMARISKDTDDKVTQVASIREGLKENAKAQRHLAVAMTETGEVFACVAKEFDENADKAEVVVEVLDELVSANETEDEPIGYCANCGEPIYSEDDYDDTENEYFCSDECYNEYAYGADNEDEDEIEDEETSEEEIKVE